MFSNSTQSDDIRSEVTRSIDLVMRWRMWRGLVRGKSGGVFFFVAVVLRLSSTRSAPLPASYVVLALILAILTTPSRYNAVWRRMKSENVALRLRLCKAKHESPRYNTATVEYGQSAKRGTSHLIDSGMSLFGTGRRTVTPPQASPSANRGASTTIWDDRKPPKSPCSPSDPFLCLKGAELRLQTLTSRAPPPNTEHLTLTLGTLTKMTPAGGFYE